MHKGKDLFKDNYYEKNKLDEIVDENRVVFLDIDGVLQPGTQKRFDHDNKKLKEYLHKKYNDPRYLEAKDYDIGTVYYDWRPTSVGILKEILDTTVSSIVLSSDWRDTNFNYLKAFFRLYDLEDYLIDVTDPNIYIPKKVAIKNYLDNHKEIKKYIILDDSNFYEEFGPNFKLVRNEYNSLTEYDLKYARFLFNMDKSSIDLDNKYSLGYESIDKHVFIVDNIKVLYLDNFKTKYSLYLNEILTYMLADIFYKNKDIDLIMFKNDFDLDSSIGYKDNFGFITISRGLYNIDTSNIKHKVLKIVNKKN